MTGKRLAVLIDAENAQVSVMGNLLTEIAKLGVATAKRIYGDFTCPLLSRWRQTLLDHSIHPVQQFRNTTGKNASDSALIIDAMDLLHSRKFDGFCIVSSDSDFTRLASRIREDGVSVYGFGERKTPTSFVAACDKFIYIETAMAAPPVAKPVPAKPVIKRVEPPVALLCDAVEASTCDGGWASLSAVGTFISERAPDFDSRTYGHAKLTSLLQATGRFDLDWHGKEGAPTVVHVRVKPLEC